VDTFHSESKVVDQEDSSGHKLMQCYDGLIEVERMSGRISCNPALHPICDSRNAQGVTLSPTT
jgi:hypothetical protein